LRISVCPFVIARACHDFHWFLATPLLASSTQASTMDATKLAIGALSADIGRRPTLATAGSGLGSSSASASPHGSAATSQSNSPRGGENISSSSSSSSSSARPSAAAATAAAAALSGVAAGRPPVAATAAGGAGGEARRSTQNAVVKDFFQSLLAQPVAKPQAAGSAAGSAAGAASSGGTAADATNLRESALQALELIKKDGNGTPSKKK
jgi:hypothetical protein